MEMNHSQTSTTLRGEGVNIHLRAYSLVAHEAYRLVAHEAYLEKLNIFWLDLYVPISDSFVSMAALLFY